MNLKKLLIVIYFTIFLPDINAEFGVYDSKIKPKIPFENAITIADNYLKKIVKSDLLNKFYKISMQIGAKDGSSWYVVYASENHGKYTIYVDGLNAENWYRFYPNKNDDQLLPEIRNLPMWSE